MIKDILLLIVGFAFLIKGADVFVDGSSNLAKAFKIPKLIIGLTVVGFGTSAPELAVSIQAMLSGNTDMVLGNVLGSNIFNILAILGVSALIFPFPIHKDVIKKDLPFLIILSTLLIAFVYLGNQTLSRVASVIILTLFILYMAHLIITSLKDSRSKKIEKPDYGKQKSIVYIVLGLMAIVFGSNFVVSGASSIATALGMSERMVSLTIVALGTSLPELATSIMAAGKKETDLLVGNIIGSNLFNIAIVLALPIIIYGSVSVSSFMLMDIIYFIGSTIILFLFSFTKKKISRIEGLIMFLLYAGYYVLLFL